MKVVVLGGGYAGIICALRLARKGAEVTLVNASDRFVERIRLHEAAVGRERPVRSVARFLEGSSVELAIGRAARVEGKTVVLDDGRALAWDHLVLALGSRFETRPGTVSLDGRLTERLAGAKSVLVVGGGLTGIEAASEIAEAWPGLAVTLATRGHVGAGFTEAARAHVERVFARMKIDLLENTDYASVTRKSDVTIWAGGFSGAPLPAGLDVKTNARGQVLVEPTMRALGTEAIWACGDLAAQAFPPAIPVPMGCKAAGPTAARVADNIMGAEAAPLDYVAPGYCVSLGRRDGFVELVNGRVITGRPAAWIKELVCRATLWAFPMERYGLINYARFGAGNIRALPAVAS
jgi:NADH dehydrogenase FAD-containing subunit